jgi:predicted O-linked N-acetylglucosamine transferase (SPINDLY family)
MALTAEDAVILLQQAKIWYRDGAHAQAEEACTEALAIDQANPDALSLLAMLLHQRGDTATAITLLRRACRISPAGRLYSNLGVVLSSNRDYVGGITAYRQAIRLDPMNVTSWTNLLFALDHHPEATPALRIADRRAFNAMHCAALTAAAPPHTNDRDPDRKLRIGYVSGDFFNHSASIAWGPVLFGHDHERFEAWCYDNTAAPRDQETLRFEAVADQWVPIQDRSDEDVARQIRADQIDILVDLSGFSTGGRLLIFARKPAPIQITGWGHATGTGLDCMDYLISDAVTIPPEHEHLYHERIIRLPSAMGFDVRPPYPEVAPPPMERNGYPTFGYIGRAYKLNERTLSTWAEILRRMPTAKLILKSAEYNNQDLREWVLAVLASLGVTPDRVSIRGSTTRLIHLATYNEIDVHLDPYPHGGGVTTLEACLMGVPTVTLLGDYVSGRLSASVLDTVYPSGGTTATTVTDYLLLASSALCGASLYERQRLRDAILSSVMASPERYAACVENAFRDAWKEWVIDAATP